MTGRGAAFGVHQAMDQTGAVVGPLLLAVVLSLDHGGYRLAFGILVVPGVIVLVILGWLRRRVPDPIAYERDAMPGPDAEPALGLRVPLPAILWRYVGVVALLSCGVASFPLLAFHAETVGLLSTAQIPLLFALAMLIDGLSGLIMGRLYDQQGPQVLLTVPVAASFAAVAFTHNAALVWVGVAVWGVVNGVLDSTVKAVVTELVPSASRAAAFGWLALVRGIGLLLAGAVLGLAYDSSVGLVISLILAVNIAALFGLATVLRHVRTPTHPAMNDSTPR
jgi:MFS family permease